jgi:PAS domain S-box-containing protein
MQSALDQGRGNDERWHQKKNGTCFWASGEMMPLTDENGTPQGFLKILRDRTDQRQAAEAQRADAEFLHSVLASSGDCIKVLDLDAKLEFMNEGGLRVMEVSDFNAIRGCPWPSFWPAEGQEEAWAAIETARAGASARFQGFADTMKGTRKCWDVQVTAIPGAHGRPEKLLAVSRDITEQKRIEGELRELNDTLQYLGFLAFRDPVPFSPGVRAGGSGAHGDPVWPTLPLSPCGSAVERVGKTHARQSR